MGKGQVLRSKAACHSGAAVARSKRLCELGLVGRPGMVPR